MEKRERLLTKRTNIFDGQLITEKDLDTEQIHNNALVSNLVVDFHGSGVVKTTPFEDQILLDTRNPGLYADDSENASQSDLEAGTFDGKGIALDTQPSDLVRGNRLEFELVDADLRGREKTKVLVLGRAFDGLNSSGNLVLELLEFFDNSKLISQNYYLSVLAVFFNHFSGGSGKTEESDSAESLDVISENDGYMIIREAPPLSVYPASVMSSQVESPNFGLNNFITSTTSRSISDEIEIALGSSNSIEDLYIELDGKEQLEFEKDGATTVVYGQKFLAKTNNIQRIDVLLSVERDEDLDLEEQLDFSGDLVISIHELISEVSCPTDAIPDDLIDFDPEITPLVESSFSQEDLELLGYKLNETPQLVSFNFAGTLIADPNLDPSIQENKYYAFLISRRGDNRTGTVRLEKGFDKVDKKTDLGITLTIVESFGKQQSKFVEYDPTSKKYINDSQSSLWYRIHSDAVEVSDGTAYTDSGVAVSVQKTEKFVGGTEISHFENNISLRTVAEGANNYLVMSQEEEFSESSTHPRTNNRVFTRIQDVPVFTVVNSDELNDLLEDSIPLLLAKIVDTNVRDAQNLTGTFEQPGLVKPDTIYLVDPGNDVLNSNLVNRIIIPDTDCDCNARYRITRVDCQNIKAGDLNSDGELTSEDLTLLLDIVGSTINSAATEKSILGGDLDILDFIKSDLNDDETVDGTDIGLLEDAVDGYVNFTVPEEIKVLTLQLENILTENDYPNIFTDTDETGETTAGEATLTFTVSSTNIGLTIRAGDTVIIPSGADDAGTYTVNTKTVADNGLDLTLTLLNSDGSTPTFIGSSAFDVEVNSGTKVNTFADNPDLADVPFVSKNYEIEFIESPFEPGFVEICDLRRDVGVSFLELEDDSCLCTTEDCLPEVDCEPNYKNQTYLPGDLYLPNGNILVSPGVPHPGDFEYTNITLPLPAGSITDCSLDLYTNFVKSDSGTCFTVAGFPAMKFSDGSLVGCSDSGTDTDLTRGRVKFDHKVSSIYVDSLIDGYADGYGDAETTLEAVEVITENFFKFSYDSFEDWGDDALNNTTITDIDHGVGPNEPAVFSLTTSSDSGVRFGRLNSPAEVQDFSGDFIVDFRATRTTWASDSLTNGTVSSFATLTITNTDNSVATLKLGWKVVGGFDTKLFYSGVIEDEDEVVISTFDFQIDAPDSLGDEVAFRLRRINDVVSAYYIIPDQIVESTSSSFGHYVRVGTNPDVQPGEGTVVMDFEISQENSPTTDLNFFVRLSEVIIETDYTSDDDATSIEIGRNSTTNEVNDLIFTIPFSLTRRTTVVSATLNLVSGTTGTITDDFNLIPIKLLDADNLGTVSNVPLEEDSDLMVVFAPGTVISGETISIDVTDQFSSLLSETGHLPGFLKGFLLEPNSDNNASLTITSAIEIVVEYEDTSTGVVFKVGVSIDPSTGIATFNTRNILYDALSEASRTVLTFGVYLKKAGFKNNDVSLTIDDLSRLGIGTCFEESIIEEDGQCFVVVAGAGGSTFVEGPVSCP